MTDIPKIGDRVTGTYFRVPYTGTVEHRRPHTMNDDIVWHVILDEPITVFDDERRRIALSLPWGYNRDGCSIASLSEAAP